MAKTRVEDIDLGFREIEKQLGYLADGYVLVGIQEGTETEAQVKGQRSKPAGLNMAEIGYINEFGGGNVPARPFIRSAVDMNEARIYGLMQQQYSRILEGRQTAEGSLRSTGVYVEGLIKQRIRAITSPPNAPYTIAQKGSSKPLIDFGQMIQSIANLVFIRQ